MIPSWHLLRILPSARGTSEKQHESNHHPLGVKPLAENDVHEGAASTFRPSSSGVLEDRIRESSHLHLSVHQNSALAYQYLSGPSG